MVKLTGVFNQIQRCKVMVVGDLMLDTYTIGKARRISPEAPVAVVHVQREEHRPGGSGNVILNLISLGADVVAVGRIGQDNAGSTLLRILAEEGTHIQGIVVQPNYPTPIKNRIIAENQQLVRVDHELVSPIPEQLEQSVIEMLPQLMRGVKVLAISDYGKGFLSRTLLAALIEQAKLYGILVIADPKGVDFSKYQGVSVIKPNLSEAFAAANLTPESPLELVASRILQMSKAETLMVTRSEAGISLFHRDGSRHDFPVRVREVKDVTGAGDTVLAMLACAMANELSITTAVQLANVAAGIAIEHFGCARVTLSELARRLLDDDVGNKVFDEEHLFALQEAMRGRKSAVLSLSSSEGLTSLIFESIRKMSKKGERDLLIYVHDASPDAAFVNLLASLHDVDFIILKGESLRHLAQVILPEEIYLIEQGTFKPLETINSLFEKSFI